MSEDPVLAYLNAHQRYEKADTEWQAARRVISNVSNRMGRDTEAIFRVAGDDGRKDAFGLAPSIPEWPTAERIVTLQQERSEAGKEAKRLWERIPENRRAGLLTPPRGY